MHIHDFTHHLPVASCGSPISALRLLSGDKIKDVHVVLVNAEKATTCGFDFRAIVETDLCIPVIYCKHTFKMHACIM